MFRPSHVFECMLQVRMKEKKLVKEIVVVSCGPAQVIGVQSHKKLSLCRSQCVDVICNIVRLLRPFEPPLPWEQTEVSN